MELHSLLLQEIWIAVGNDKVSKGCVQGMYFTFDRCFAVQPPPSYIKNPCLCPTHYKPIALGLFTATLPLGSSLGSLQLCLRHPEPSVHRWYRGLPSGKAYQNNYLFQSTFCFSYNPICLTTSLFCPWRISYFEVHFTTLCMILALLSSKHNRKLTSIQIGFLHDFGFFIP